MQRTERRRRAASRWGWLGLLAVVLVACSATGGSALTPTGAPAATLTVAAASDLMLAFKEVGAAFERETGHAVTFTFGSTGQLAQQIEAGAPIDVFAAANIAYVQELASQGRTIPDTQTRYARGRIVLWTRADSPLSIERLEDLTQPGIARIAIANPDHAPYGLAAKQALQSANLWEPLQPKLVFGENIAQTLQLADTGNVEVAIVALSLGITSQGRWRLVAEELHQPLDQAVAVVTGTKHEAAARHFVTFINGPIGRPIMQRYGFVLPGEEVSR